MAFGSGPTGQELNAEINVTPLVDVMLVVLIIFMLVTPMLQKGVGVDLPKARNVLAVPENKDQVVLVVVRQNGELFIENDPTTWDVLERRLRRRHDVSPGLQLQVKADRNVTYGDIKKVLRAGREAGFAGASLIAEEIRDTQSASAGPTSR